MDAKGLIRVTSAVAAAFLLALTSWPLDAQNETSPPGANPTEAAPRTASELQSLVAPIALYPDSLVAQVLTGATFPDQIAVANYWLQENKGLTGSALMHAVDGQSWDASVKALTEFPSVLDNMAKNLAWTSSLGEAYHDQRPEVMTAIQTLRAQAKAQGTLKSSSQVTVSQQSPEVIVIQPANPQIVYVPQYNPSVVYGTPYVVPNYVAPVYSTSDVAAAGIIGFGAGIAVGAMMSGGCCSWGYSSWNCGWHSTAVVYRGGSYYGNSAWHGGYYNGSYHGSYGYNNTYARPGGYNTYNNATNTYAHDSYNSQTRSVNQSTYNPTTKAYSQNTYNPSTGVSKNSSTTYNSSTHTATTATSYGDPNRPGSSSYTKNTSTTYNPSSHSSTTSNSWAQSGGVSHSDAYSGMNGHSGGFGNSGGWASRAESSRGWGSMRSSGYGGGRFGGGAGGFGGGRFGGFRR